MSSGSEKPRELSDVEKWIVEAHEGNSEALGRLLDICRHYLLLVASQELTPALWAKVAPSDIVQESLMVAGRHFPRFLGNSEEELLAWLRGILRNLMANVERHFDTDKRQVSREIPLTETPLEDLQFRLYDRKESPSGLAQAREQDEQLERAVRELPEHYRQVLLLHTTQDLTFAQIAEKLGSTTDAVRKLWGRAVDELAKLLESPHEPT